MNVVHVVRQYLPSVGGMEEVVRSLAQHQHQGGRYQPSVLTLNRVFRTGGPALSAREDLAGVPVRRLGFCGSERYPLCPQVALALRQADLVHVHGVDFFFDYLALLHPLMRKPLVASTHGGFFHSGYARRWKQLYFQTVTRLSALAYRTVIATSENDGAMFSTVVRPDRLTVIENGVDLHKFDSAACAELRPVMVYFGRWSINKGLLECLDLLSALRSQQPETPWQLLIAGREYDLDAAALRNYAHTRGVADCVTLLPNPDNAQLRTLIGQASYFLCLSHHEGFGIAPIEAISAGLVPLLSPIAPFVRLWKATGTGALLDAATPTLQAGQVHRLHTRLAMDADRRTQERASVRAAIQVYSWAGVADRYTQAYDRALGLP